MEQIQTKQIKNYLYNPQNKLGKGSFSTVYLGKHITTNEVVAIKVIDVKTPKSDIERFLIGQQIRALKLMNHENVIKTTQIYQTTNNIYIIYQYCQLGDLANYIKSKGKLSQQEAIQIIIQILLGIIHIHGKGVVHRDIKSQNILIKNGIKEKIFKIIDFGFCQLADNKLQQGYNVGSPLYMSPQAYKSSKYSIKSDLWAVGIIFLQMILGDLPFRGQEYDNLIKQFVNEEPYKTQNWNPQLKNIISRMLSIQIQKRIEPIEAYNLLCSYRAQIANLKSTSNTRLGDQNQQASTNNLDSSNPKQPLAINRRREFMQNQKNIRGSLLMNHSPAPRLKPKDLSPAKPIDKAMAYLKQKDLHVPPSKQLISSQIKNPALKKLQICNNFMSFITILDKHKSLFNNSERIILLSLKIMKQYLQDVTAMFQQDNRVLNEQQQQDLKTYINTFNQLQLSYNQNKHFSDLYFSFNLEYLRLQTQYLNYLQFWIKQTLVEFKSTIEKLQCTGQLLKLYLFLKRINQILQCLKKNPSKTEFVNENSVIDLALKQNLDSKGWSIIQQYQQRLMEIQI